MSAQGCCKKMTVEECASVISAKFLQKGGFLTHQAYTSNIVWSCCPTEASDVTFVLSQPRKEGLCMTLMYTRINEFTGAKESITQEVQIVWTPCHFGGRRWWFLCPLVHQGMTCGRRVSILYLGRGKHFGCRHCYNLTYRSCQEHDKRMDPLIKNPSLLMSYLESKDHSKILLALKASIKADEREGKRMRQP